MPSPALALLHCNTHMNNSASNFITSAAAADGKALWFPTGGGTLEVIMAATNELLNSNISQALPLDDPAATVSCCFTDDDDDEFLRVVPFYELSDVLLCDKEISQTVSALECYEPVVTAQEARDAFAIWEPPATLFPHLQTQAAPTETINRRKKRRSLYTDESLPQIPFYDLSHLTNSVGRSHMASTVPSMPSMGDESLRVIPFLEFNKNIKTSALKYERRKSVSRRCRVRKKSSSSKLSRQSLESRDDDVSSLCLVPFLEFQDEKTSRSLRSMQYTLLFPREILVPRYNNVDRQSTMQQPTILTDPTESLLYGRTFADPLLMESAETFKVLLDVLTKDHDDRILTGLVRLMRRCPEVCQVQYPIEPELIIDMNVGASTTIAASTSTNTNNNKTIYCYPIVHFSAIDCLIAVQTCYEACAELIATPTSQGWCPLHYAVWNHAPLLVISYLHDRFPTMMRKTHGATHQTALHLACQRSGSSNDDDCNKSAAVIQFLLRAYPTATQLADCDGWTPLHYYVAAAAANTSATTVDHLDALNILQALASPTVLGARTRQHQKMPLHVLCQQQTPTNRQTAFLKCLLELDGTLCMERDEKKNCPLHYYMEAAVTIETAANWNNGFMLLVQACPQTVYWPNDRNETPLQVAERFGLAELLLKSAL